MDSDSNVRKVLGRGQEHDGVGKAGGGGGGVSIIFSTVKVIKKKKRHNSQQFQMLLINPITSDLTKNDY